jgi:hypothetical protein
MCFAPKIEWKYLNGAERSNLITQASSATSNFFFREPQIIPFLSVPPSSTGTIDCTFIFLKRIQKLLRFGFKKLLNPYT